MRSGTSFFNVALYKKTVTRWWPIWAAYLTVWFFALPANFIINMPSSSVDFAGRLWGFFFMSYLTAIIYALVCAMAVLSHLYSTRPVNFYGALPVKREGIFATQYLAGLSFAVVPNVIVAALTALVSASVGVLDMGAILTWLGVGCFEIFFFYTFAVLCGMLVGHVLALPVFYAVFNVVVIAALALLEEVISGLYYGFAGFDEWIYRFAMWLTPAGMLENVSWVKAGATSLRFGVSLKILLVYTAAAVVMCAVALFLYRSRRMESAGDVVAVSPLKPVFKYGVAVCSGLFLGYVTAVMLDMGILPFAVVAWTVIGYFAAQMMLDKTFRVFKKWRGALAVGLAAAAAMAVMVFDLTGFQTNVPDASEVESVDVHHLSVSYIVDGSGINSFTVSDPEEIEYIIALHRAALDEDAWRYGFKAYGHLYLDFTYHTKSGDISRRYSTIRFYEDEVDKIGSGAWALEGLFADRDVWRQVYGLDKLDEFIAAGGVPRVSFEYAPENYDATPETQGQCSVVDITDYDDVMAVIKALEQDFYDGNIGRSRVGEMYDFRDAATIDIVYSPDNRWDKNIKRVYFHVTADAKNTLAAVYAAMPESAGG